MGFGKKKKTTTTVTENVTIIQHKIIKFTYLQTLSVVGGIGDIKELAGETEASSEENSPDQLSDGNLDKLGRLGTIGGFLGGGSLGGALGGNAARSLFGKKTTVDSTISIEDSGWRVVKTWLQPEFDKIRYALGIRELTIAQFRYEKVSEVISTPWISPKDITKVTLIVDQFIPPQFPPGQDYIQYYVKPELPDSTWSRINPIGNRTVFDREGNLVPRILNFNTERPATARLEDAFITTKEEVKQVRFRAVLSRPDTIAGSDVEADGFTPILKSYRMLLHPRGGL